MDKYTYEEARQLLVQVTDLLLAVREMRWIPKRVHEPVKQAIFKIEKVKTIIVLAQVKAERERKETNGD